MKYLGEASKILDMQIRQDRKAKKLWLSQEKYVEKVLQKFNIDNAKAVSFPLAQHFKLLATMSLTIDGGMVEILKFLYI